MPRDHRPETDPSPNLAELPLGEFIGQASHGTRQNPRHFGPMLEVLTAAPRGGLRIALAAPRQHGKTETVKHAFPWWQLRHPRDRFFYATYAQEYTEIQSRDIRRILLAAGGRIRADHNTLKGWTLESLGLFIASSVEGPGNGLGFNVGVIDDPFSGPEQAYSKLRRDQVYTWFKQVVMPMAAPGATILIIASRWDEDDLSGRLIRSDGFDEMRIPAIADGSDAREVGEPLCPWGPNPAEPRTLEFLLELRDGRMGADGIRRGGMGKHAFAALMQGRPEPREGALFEGARLAGAAAPHLVRVTLGVDLGYGQKKSDHSGIVGLGEDELGGLYVVHAAKTRRSLPVVVDELRKCKERYPEARMVSYVSGPEIGVLDLMMLIDPPAEIERMPARFNKLVRAQATARAWNNGRIAVLSGQPWTEPFMHEVKYFSGDEGGEDNQVDALVAAFDASEVGRPIQGFDGGFAFGRACL